MEQMMLTKIQQQALRAVMQNPSLNGFYLSGGTALSAFFLHHRLSDDLDFFSSEPIDGMAIESAIQELKSTLGTSSLRFEKLHDRRLFFFALPAGELKMEFTLYPYPILENHKVIDGTRVDSLRDISANKLMAFLDRFDPKDFVDLYYILQTHSIGDLRMDAEHKFGVRISNIFLGGELMKVRRIEALPKMLLPLTIDELKYFFSEQAKTLATETFE